MYGGLQATIGNDTEIPSVQHWQPIMAVGLVAVGSALGVPVVCCCRIPFALAVPKQLLAVLPTVIGWFVVFMGRVCTHINNSDMTSRCEM